MTTFIGRATITAASMVALIAIADGVRADASKKQADDVTVESEVDKDSGQRTTRITIIGDGPRVAPPLPNERRSAREPIAPPQTIQPPNESGLGQAASPATARSRTPSVPLKPNEGL